MKTNATSYVIVFLSVLLFGACTKQNYLPAETTEQSWMRTHDKGIVSYVDYSTGNYIVETNQGYSVIQGWGGITPRQYDNEFAWFSNAGVQTMYNYDGNYFTKASVVQYWLNWSDALVVLDALNHGQ